MGKRIYYKEIESEEEMLFSTEIARLYKIYRVKNSGYEIKNSLNGKLVEIIIEEYIKDNNIEIEKLFYPTFSGIGRVYSASVYKPALESFLEKQYINPTHYYSSKDGAKYKFNWVRD